MHKSINLVTDHVIVCGQAEWQPPVGMELIENPLRKGVAGTMVNLVITRLLRST